jgi:hypothetical protein
MWSWIDPSLDKAIEARSGKPVDTYLTGPLGAIACITEMKSRYECTISLPNAKPVSLCMEKTTTKMSQVKLEVCKVVLNLLAGCSEQLKNQCGEDMKDYLIVPHNMV